MHANDVTRNVDHLNYKCVSAFLQEYEYLMFGKEGIPRLFLWIHSSDEEEGSDWRFQTAVDMQVHNAVESTTLPKTP